MKTIKLPGFTLVELIIVLLLSALVTTTCFSLFSFANESSNAFSQKNAAYLEIASFAEAFEKELFLSTAIEMPSANEIQIKAPGFSNTYFFSESGIEKNFISPKEASLKFELPAKIIRFDKDYNSFLRQVTAVIEIEFSTEEKLKLFFEKK